MITLDTPISELSRVGKTTAGRLKKLKIETAQDLLFYFPFRYDDFSQLVKIVDLKPDLVATVRGKIEIIDSRRSHRRRMMITEALLTDDSGSVKAVWFNQPFLKKTLTAGQAVFLSGRVSGDRLDLQFVSPAYEPVKAGGQTHTARLVPIYPTTQNLTQRQIRFLIKLVLPLADKITDWLPLEIIKKNKLLGLSQALREIHFPTDQVRSTAALRRLKFEELFLIQLNVQLVRQQLRDSQAVAIEFKEKEIKKFVAGLPWPLTIDQKKAAWRILQDLASGRPMNRLLEGDVGSGKTVVALMAAINVGLNHCQAALMVPTEILASQHFDKICGLLNQPANIKVALLTRTSQRINFPWADSSTAKLTKPTLLKLIAKGKIDLVIGTQALIQQGVEFKKLALVIIDEQHRFGVSQRQALKIKSGLADPTIKSYFPHLLSMTATPIPRSLALTVFGDLDLSIIREMPKGRQKIITKVVAPEKRPAAYDFIKKEIANGRQVFVICPLIEPSDKLGVKSVKLEHEKLDREVFPDLTTGLLHGRLKAQEREKIMADFLANKIKILVATSVVEVGIDVPNATVMMIEGAERFGLAQLHQFRGRVGRSQWQSYCFLFTENQGEKIQQRLQALVESEDGFALAEKDLEFRGPGEIYGTRQSGLPDLKIACLTDYDLIREAREAAQDLVQSDAELKKYPALLEKLAEFNLNTHLE